MAWSQKFRLTPGKKFERRCVTIQPRRRYSQQGIRIPLSCWFPESRSGIWIWYTTVISSGKTFCTKTELVRCALLEVQQQIIERRGCCVFKCLLNSFDLSRISLFCQMNDLRGFSLGKPFNKLHVWNGIKATLPLAVTPNDSLRRRCHHLFHMLDEFCHKLGFSATVWTCHDARERVMETLVHLF